MKSEKTLIAPCGLDCAPCSLRMIPIDTDAAKEAIDWYKSKGWLKEDEEIDDVIERGLYCKGCRSDRSDVHWSPDCEILTCCIDDKQLEFCYQCDDFICDHLREWGKMGRKYQEAIENLKRMKTTIE